MATLKEALRGLARTPGFTATTILSVGVAIGLAASAFTVGVAAFFGQLPYPEPDRLLEVWQTERPGSSAPQDYLQPARMLAWADVEPRHLESITGAGMGPALTLMFGDTSVRVDATPIVGDWFGTMGVQARRGRVLTPQDERPGAERAAVVSSRFARERSADVGSTLDLSGAIYTVVGVMPAEFELGEKVWIAVESLPDGLEPVAYAGVARLRPGSTAQQGAAEIEQMAVAQVTADSSRFGRVGATATPFGSVSQGANRPRLWLLSGVVLAVLLIGISNLTQLFLVRAQGRSRALAVRAALGGSVWQIGRGLAMEGMIIGAGGGAVGLTVTIWGKEVVRSFLGGEYALPSAPTIGAPVVVFAFALAAFVSVAVGLEPLRRLGALDLQGLLQRRAAGSVATPAERRSQRIMVAVQVAVCVVLVVTAAVLGTAYEALTGLDMGYDANRVVEAMPDYGMARMAPPASWDLARHVGARLSARPEISGVALWQEVGEEYPPRPDFDAKPDGPPRNLQALDRLGRYYLVEPGTLQALGIDLVAGRPLSNDDGPEQPLVALATRSGVAAWWPGEDPLGHQIRLGMNGPSLTIVGVVEDTHLLNELGRGLATRPDGRHLPVLFVSHAQLPTPPVGWREFGCCAGVMIGVRPAFSTTDAATVLRQELTAAAPNLPIAGLGTMQSLQVSRGYIGRSVVLTGRLVAAGVLIALALAVLGILGVVREGLSRRAREIGLRVALGARARQVIGTAARESVVTSLAGVGLGLAVIFLLNATLSDLVFDYYVLRLTGGVLDPPALAAAAALVVLVAATTATAGSAQAARVDPAVALRSE